MKSKMLTGIWALILVPSFAFAQDAAAPQQPWWVSAVPILFMFVVVYFLMIRPQAKAAREKPLFMETLRAISDGPIFLEAGGQLIRDATGEIIGAIGVTGDVNEVDDICAMAGIQAAGFKCDSDFNDEDCRRLNIKKDEPVRDPR